MRATLQKWLSVDFAETTVSREIRAGFTTFMAMAYILFVNPQILSPAIVIQGTNNISAQILSATAIAAAFGSILMGFLAKMPIALAPGMGLNAYFTYSVVLGHGLPWQTALGAVFVSGIVFLILTLSGFREAIINAIPVSIKRASGAGIGMFLALIGMQASGIVISHPTTMVTLGHLNESGPLLAIFGLVLTVSLSSRKIPGAILIGIATTSLLAIVFKLPVFGGKSFQGFTDGIISLPVLPTDLVGALNIRDAMDPSIFGIVFTFLFVAFFDTAGTLLGLADIAKLTDARGKIPRTAQAFATDAIATTVGALIGTSTTTAYMESAAGIEDGGKSGLVAVTVGVLFLLSLFIWPMASAVPAVATAPALILIGAMLMESCAKITWNDLAEAIPAFITIIGMPLTFSIAHGITLGILTHVLIYALMKRYREVHPVMYGLAVVLLLKFVLL